MRDEHSARASGRKLCFFLDPLGESPGTDAAMLTFPDVDFELDLEVLGRPFEAGERLIWRERLVRSFHSGGTCHL